MTEPADLEGVPEVGEVLLGKYRVERVIGSGGMGVVVAATHLSLGQTVAIKFLLAEAARNPKNVTRFSREARAVARIQSDHVARVSDIGSLPSGAPFMVMEYLEGEDLAGTIERHGALPVETAVCFILQACEALAEAHAAGIVHRDLKPENLFLTSLSDGSGRIKVLDFGISKIAVEPGGQMEDLTKTSAMMGSPMYMAPEQMRSAKTADRRADIWAIGAILFELLAGQPPFAGATLPQICSRILTWPPEPLAELAPHVPEPVVTAVLRCLDKDVNARYQSLAELADVIAPFGGVAAHRSAELIRRVTTTQPGPQQPHAAHIAQAATQPAGNLGLAPAAGSTKRTSGLIIALGVALLLVALTITLVIVLMQPQSDPNPAQRLTEASSPTSKPEPSRQPSELSSASNQSASETTASSAARRPGAGRKPAVAGPTRKPQRPPPAPTRPGDELFTTRAP